MNPPAASMAIVLRRNGFLGIAFAVVLLAVAPFMRPAHDLAFWLIWPLLLVSALIVLGIAAHLLFDAALFRLIASSGETGLAEVDHILERMGLRSSDGAVRPLAARIEGSRRIMGRLRFFMGLGIVLFILLATVPLGQPLGWGL
ncbi:hypothetical protein F9K91_01215 [Brucella tritici]|uniref:Uncharacterized protein n=1 Tax=Brucella tritici TaxID=94626 RepID=A0A7X6FS13_9HYPH|nr:hypothetical protein [Brucella tritici]KAB2667394.1 hypothetical protein F9K91_01215 [Brucella tritici]NKW10849.1 hypothetical protein [Brucella tritici]